MRVFPVIIQFKYFQLWYFVRIKLCVMNTPFLPQIANKIVEDFPF
jgi:hypothetical protein